MPAVAGLIKLVVNDKGVQEMLRQPAMGAILAKAGEQGAAYARTIAPERSGRYKASLRALTPSVGPDGVLVGGFGSDAFNWHFVEFGTVNQAPQRVLTNAAMAVTGGYVSEQR